MKLIWVLLLLTATVALVRAEEEEQELVDVEDTELDEIEEITDDEQGDEELEDPGHWRRKLRHQRRRSCRPHVCKYATIKCLKAVKIMKIAKEGKCKMALRCIGRGVRCGFCMHKRHGPRPSRRPRPSGRPRPSRRPRPSGRPRPSRRPRPSGRPRPTRPSRPAKQPKDEEEEEESDDEIEEDPRRRPFGRRHRRRGCKSLLFRARLRFCGILGKACAIKSGKGNYCGKLICVGKFVRCLKGRKPRRRRHRHDEILEDMEDEELAEMPEEFSVEEGIEEDEEQMDPGHKKSKKTAHKVCKIAGISCFLKSPAPYRLSKRICKIRAMKCVKCLGGWDKPFRKTRKHNKGKQ